MNASDLRPLGPEGRLILWADARLTKHLRLLMSSGRLRRKRLISEFLGKTLLDTKEAQRFSPYEIWRAFPEASFCRKQLYQRRFRLPGGDFLDQFSDYLLERFDGDHRKVSEVFRSGESGTLDSWNELLCGCPDRQVKIEIKRVCDWIEADAALIAFGNYRRHRPTMARDPVKAFGATIGLILRKLSKQDSEHRLRFEEDWAREALSRPNIERDQTFINALEYADNLGSRGCCPFETILFRLWPVIIHQTWDLMELTSFLRHVGVQLPDAFRNPTVYLLDRGLRSAITVGDRGNGRGSRAYWQLPGRHVARQIATRWKATNRKK
jgi:hypothetical protein